MNAQNNNAQDNDILPLYDLWQQLRKAGLPLGLYDYFQFLEALRLGFGLKDLNALRHLCYALWIRSDDERRLFDYYFNQIMTPVTRFQLPDTPFSQNKDEPGASPALATEEEQHTEMKQSEETDESIVQAVQVPESEYKASYERYDFSDEYFPLTRQQMRLNWRYLRHLIRSGRPAELDVEATVHEVGRKGIFLEPVWMATHKRMTRLILLIDYGGSMVPFHMLSQRLVKTLLSEGFSDEVGIYYFRNYPTDYLYCDTTDQEYKSVEEVLSKSNALWTNVLVFSDAGSARGNFSSERIEQTVHFIKRFEPHFQHMAWLNPVPRERWSGSTASVVQRSISMFDLENHGLDAAIDILCGRFPRNSYKQEIHLL